MADINKNIAAQLNRYTGHVVDWNRVGELLQSNHRYSYDELFTRLAIILGAMIGTYVLGSFMAYIGLNMYISYSIAFLISSTISHGLAIEELIMKRLSMKADIDELIKKIDNLTIGSNPDVKIEVLEKIDHIMNLEAKNSASSATLGMRKRLLSELLDGLLSK